MVQINRFVLFSLMFLFLFSYVSAVRVDYSPNDKGIKDMKAVVKDTILFGLISVGEQGTMELKSHKSPTEIIEVGTGWQVTMIYDTNFGQAHKNILGNVYFYDLKTGEEVEREYKFVYWGTEEREREVCIEYQNITNSTTKDSIPYTECSKYINESYLYEGWLDYNSKDLPKGQIKLGLMTNVLYKDKIDGVWEVQGKKIEKHAGWTSGLSVGLVSYYKLDETSGTTTIDSHGSNNGTISGATVNVAGKIDKAYDFDGTNDYVQIDNEEAMRLSGGSYSISFWFKADSISKSRLIWKSYSTDGTIEYDINIADTSAGKIDFRTNDGKLTSSTSVSVGNWYHIVVVRDLSSTGTEQKLYINAGTPVTRASTGTTTTGNDNKKMQIGRYFFSSTAGDYFNGIIDEVGIWSRALSSEEVSELYNSGTGITYKEPLIINLISPINYYNSSSSTIDFSANLTDEGDLGIANVSLVINNTIYDTNTSGLTGVYNFSETLSDGFYEWYIEAYDDTDKLYESETRYFTIDTLAPSIEILSPVTSYNYLQPDQTIDLNVTVTDEHLDNCWYEYNSSIINFNCSENQTFNYVSDVNNLTVYANDTFGNEKNESVSWSYKVLQGSIVYDNISYEGLDSSFYNFITLNGAIQGAYLEYGNTNYTSSIYLNNNTFLYNQISLPNIEADVNNTFFWWIKIDDEWFQTVSNVQLVKAMEVTNCTTSTLLSLNLKDEKLQTSLNGTLEVLLNVISQSGTEVFVYNNTFTNKNNVQFCLSPVDLDKSLFKFNAQIKYSSTDYASELYNIQDAELSDYPQNLSLYDLANNQSTKFKITYKGSDFIPKEGVLVQLLRKYIGGDSYKVVEAPITSSLGEVILHIDQDTNLYNIIISRDGEVLDTYENIIFTCDTALVGLCTFDLDGVINPYNEISTDILNDVTFQITELNDTNVMVTFSSISGTPVNVRLLVKKNSIIGESYIYNNSLYSSAGSFNVILNDDTNMGIGENIYLFTFIKDDEVIGTKSFLLNNAGMDWDNNNYFIVVILLLSVVGMAFTSPELVIFNAVLTFLIAGSLWLLNGMSFAVGLGSLIWLVIASGILIFKLSHQEDR